MELYYRQDELQNLIDTLESLVDDSEYYKQFNDVLNDIRFQAQDILDEIGEQIAEQERKELEEENRQFISSRI
jgi:ElaB/YqjD/DUF883 family membrane-anchored ribosome-binding protein